MTKTLNHGDVVKATTLTGKIQFDVVVHSVPSEELQQILVSDFVAKQLGTARENIIAIHGNRNNQYGNRIYTPKCYFVIKGEN
jgi:Ni,Fe-hydrogenase maturation factor